LAAKAAARTIRSFGSRSDGGNGSGAGVTISACRTRAATNLLSVRSCAASRLANFGRPTTSANSANKSADNTNVARPCSSASIRREEGPLQSVPEISVLVSTTSFTSGAFDPDFIDNLLDFVHGHWFAGNRAEIAGHLEEVPRILASRDFAGDQL